jgi:hypothetical protein
MNRETLALVIAFSAGLLACSGGAGNDGTSNPGALGGAGGVVDTGGLVDTGGVVGAGGVVDTGGVLGTGGVQAGGSQATSCRICPAGLVCERNPPAVCDDPNWAEWPVPNSQVDVTAGAPNLESYTDNGDGTVTDNVTGLMWQQVVAATKYAWADAVAYCPTLTLAGHSDWRLPSVIELLSIVDLGQSDSPLVHTINPTYFPSTPSDDFWSASLLAGSSSNAWHVSFDDGSTNNDHVYYTNDVRCVR